MQLRVLGPVEVHADDGQVLTLPRRQERCLLAILLLEAGRSVPLPRLCGLIWDDDPPPGATSAVRTYVARVRSLLNQARASEHGIAVVAQRGGYRLDTDPEIVDVHRFRRLLDQATTISDPVERHRLLREALALWRGPALYSAGTQRLRERLCAGLDELHMRAQEEYLAVAVEVGRHQDVLPEVARLTIEHPARERLVEIHMTALHRAGRSADALDAYTRIRTHLADTLGLDPGPALQQLHVTILRSGQQAPSPRRSDPVPAQLPADLPVFVGRTDQLDALDSLLPPAGQDVKTRTVIISAITGTAGVGKTALAVRWAHQIADRFPDGQLYLNLRGFDPIAPPIPPAEAIRRFLDDLRVPSERIPANLDAQIAFYRTLLAGKRTLLVLDNARDSDQVRPLLPGAPGCLVLITSRNQLTGLIATDGARPVPVDLVTPEEARQLLAARLGTARTADEPAAVDDLIKLCARLPLALAIAAALAATRPTARLATIASDMRLAHSSVDALTGDDTATNLRAVLDCSYRALNSAAARLFRLLGLHPGPDISTTAAASLAGVPPDQAEPVLTELTRAHLLTEPTPRRYTFHDLLRAYAASRVSSEDPPDDRRAALTRLFDYYLSSAAAAMDRLHPAESDHRPRIPGPRTAVPAMTDPGAARDWLDTERSNLGVVAGYTADHGWPAHTVQLSAILFRYLASGHHTDALAVHGHARRAAQCLGDPIAEAHALSGLGTAHGRMGRYGLAVEHFTLALQLSRQAGDPVGQARALANLSVVEDRLSRYGPSADYLRQALDLFRHSGDRANEARALSNLGVIDARLGRYQEALDHHGQALDICRQIGDRSSEAWTLSNIGDAEEQLCCYTDAVLHHEQAMELFRLVGHRSGEAWTLDSLGRVCIRLGQLFQAAGYLEQASLVFREIGDRDGEASTANGLGEAALAAGRPTDALTQHTAAHAITIDTGDRRQRARAHTGLGHAHHALNQPAEARQHYRYALAIYTDLAAPEAEQVRRHLAALDDESLQRKQC